MPADPLLLPRPRALQYTGGDFTLPPQALIRLDLASPGDLLFTARTFQDALCAATTCRWEVAAGAAPPEQVALTLSVVPGGTRHPQGYELTVTPASICVIACTPAGAFYAVQTLRQLLAQRGAALPCLRASDWPDFAARGVMLDVSRDKVPTLETLFDIVDKLAAWKINQLQLYTEHTFSYRRHPDVWAEASPITGEDVLALDAYCRERFVELAPNQNAFGHMRRWLVLPAYNHLAECPNGCDTEWGRFDEPFTLNPGDPGSLDLVRDLLDELLPHFSSRQVNIGGDETVDLGQGASAEAVAKVGRGRVYLEFLLKLYREVRSRGFNVQFWDDIIMRHPELIAELPRDLIALEWGYEAEHPFDDHCAKLTAAGNPFYVCPGTSAWNTLAGRTDNALGNLRNAAESGLKHGAVGYLNTDWGDNGHWQPLPVSYLGYVAGAAYSWAWEANKGADIAETVSLHAFGDPTGAMGALAYDLGNTYLHTGVLMRNRGVLFRILQMRPKEIAAIPDLKKEKLEETRERVDCLVSTLAGIRMSTDDASLVRREYTWVADLLRHACRRGIWALDRAAGRADTALTRRLAAEAEHIQAEHRWLWQERNRPGGFVDSQARFEKMARDYELG